MNNSQFGSINYKDVIVGLLLALISSLCAYFVNAYSAGTLATINLHSILQVMTASMAGYLIVKFHLNSAGTVGREDADGGKAK